MNTVKLTIFFDGGCPLCKREVDFLQSKNQKESLRFIDINSSDFSLDLENGITYRQAMERIHALKSDGSVIKDIKVFQEAYDWIGLYCIGLSWVGYMLQQDFLYLINFLNLYINYGQNID